MVWTHKGKRSKYVWRERERACLSTVNNNIININRVYYIIVYFGQINNTQQGSCHRITPQASECLRNWWVYSRRKFRIFRQWRSYRGFRRFNEPGAPTSRGPNKGHQRKKLASRIKLADWTKKWVNYTNAISLGWYFLLCFVLLFSLCL